MFKMIAIRPEILPFIGITVLIGILIILAYRLKRATWRKSIRAGTIFTAILAAYFLYFFRDPERVSPDDNSLIVAAADGTIAKITEVYENKYMNTNTVRISIFLSLFDVHVNRAPISGKSRFLGYFPGKHLFTFQEKSSDVNQHNAILMEGEKTRCLIYQIVGPVCRRVVYWPDHDKEVDLKMGDRIGMMKFGSRLDMYFPKDDIIVDIKEGDKVQAGITVIARLRSL